MDNIFGIIKKILMNNLKNIRLMYFKLTLSQEIKFLLNLELIYINFF